MNQNVFINGVEYPGVNVVSLALESEITSHAVEEVEITEHVALKAPAFRLDMTFFDRFEGTGNAATLVETREEMFKSLRDLWLLKLPFTFESDFGVFDDMIINSLSPEETSDSGTIFAASLTITQIITVELLPIKLQVIRDVDGKIIDVVPNASNLTEILLTTPEAIIEGENKSLLEKLWEFFV